MKVKNKLVLIIGFLSILSALINGIFIYFLSKNALEERTHDQLKSIAVLKENQFNNFIDGRIKDIEGIAKEKYLLENLNLFIENNDDNSYDILTQLLNEKIDYKNSFFELFIINKNGEIYISTDQSKKQQIVSNENYYINGQKDTYIQNFYFDNILHKPAITISTPIFNNEDSLIGILAGRVDISNISEIMIERTGLGATGETYLVNKYNLVLTDLLKQEDASLKTTIHKKYLTDCFKGNNGNGIFTDYSNASVFLTYLWLEENDICLVEQIEKEEVFMSINKIRNIIIMINLFIFIIIFITGYFSSKIITNPLKKFSDATIKIGQGNLDTKIDVKSKDEIGEFANLFTKMTSDLKKSGAELKNYNKKLEMKVREKTKNLKEKNQNLEKFNNLTVKRELKMIELKKRNKELEKMLKKKKFK